MVSWGWARWRGPSNTVNSKRGSRDRLLAHIHIKCVTHVSEALSQRSIKGSILITSNFQSLVQSLDVIEHLEKQVKLISCLFRQFVLALKGLELGPHFVKLAAM